METAKVTHLCEPCTCNNDVVKFLEVKKIDPNDKTIEFTLYQVKMYDYENRFTYFLSIQDDPYPVSVTKKTAEEIIRHPEYGEKIASNVSANRCK